MTAALDELLDLLDLEALEVNLYRGFSPPEDRIRDYKAAHPKFGMFGSINTKEDCTAERGTFHPYLFTWMIHIFPYEGNFKEVFSTSDDVAHVH